VIHIGAAFLAGTEEMGWLQFALLNGLACLVWSTLLGSAGYLLGAAVLRVGDVIAAASIPLALVILVAAGSGLHFAEKRLQREADRAEAKDRAA
jgi:membrane protein DedA with SNARE-associated domain